MLKGRDLVDYLKLLEHSYETVRGMGNCSPGSRLDYLSEYIFDFTTYDPEMSELFAKKAVEVCAAITNGYTFEYIRDPEDYKWFLLMCNMPFFAGRLEWGTSIRGAWWGMPRGHDFEFDSCGLWNGEDQMTDTLRFTKEEWGEFMRAIIRFSWGAK